MSEVFVSLGSSKFKLERIIPAIEKLVTWNCDVVVQAGATYPVLKDCDFSDNCLMFEFCGRADFERYISRAVAVVGHAGAGLVMSSVAVSLKPIIIPRVSSFNEHVDDHQIDFFLALLRRGLCHGSDVLESIETIEDLINKSKLQKRSGYSDISQDIRRIVMEQVTR